MSVMQGEGLTEFRSAAEVKNQACLSLYCYWILHEESTPSKRDPRLAGRQDPETSAVGSKPDGGAAQASAP
jgi:hypothetical protein